MLKSERKIVLAHYDAQDGPRVMLAGPLDAPFAAVQDWFRRLSSGNEVPALDTEPFVEAIGGIRLLAFPGRSALEPGPGQVQGVRRVSEHEFHWHRTSEGWDYLAELIEGLVLSPSACHQYLSRVPPEDAVVVVSKGEYGDDVINRLRTPSTAPRSPR